MYTTQDTDMGDTPKQMAECPLSHGKGKTWTSRPLMQYNSQGTASMQSPVWNRVISQQVIKPLR